MRRTQKLVFESESRSRTSKTPRLFHHKPHRWDVGLSPEEGGLVAALLLSRTERLTTKAKDGNRYSSPEMVNRKGKWNSGLSTASPPADSIIHNCVFLIYSFTNSLLSQ